MKSSIESLSYVKSPKLRCPDWAHATIFYIALFLPASALAESAPEVEQATHQTGGHVYTDQENYQEGDFPPDQDYSSPYQKEVISQYDQEILDQARWSLGEPSSRRPTFNSFFRAVEQAKESREENDSNDGFQ